MRLNKIFDKWNAKYLIIVLKDNDSNNPYKAYIPAFRKLIEVPSDLCLEFEIKNTIIECLRSVNIYDQPTYSGEELSENEIKNIVIHEVQERTCTKEEAESRYIGNLWFEVKTKLIKGE